jgi:hypothetical protein
VSLQVGEEVKLVVVVGAVQVTPERDDAESVIAAAEGAVHNVGGVDVPCVAGDDAGPTADRVALAV